ncbi:DUF4158 domain-containing protein [Streptomyces sp. NPDC000594]|uniref:DUF4158 domain-containing protein n=1 Tax=Streptomyces sp. NPDC000594 TaxID=3154261 RepID=UPI003332F64A
MSAKRWAVSHSRSPVSSGVSGSSDQRQRFGLFAGTPTRGSSRGPFSRTGPDRTARRRTMAVKGARNRIGLAVQLGTVRHLRTFLDNPEDVPGGRGRPRRRTPRPPPRRVRHPHDATSGRSGCLRSPSRPLCPPAVSSGRVPHRPGSPGAAPCCSAPRFLRCGPGILGAPPRAPHGRLRHGLVPLRPGGGARPCPSLSEGRSRGRGRAPLWSRSRAGPSCDRAGRRAEVHRTPARAWRSGWSPLWWMSSRPLRAARPVFSAAETAYIIRPGSTGSWRSVRKKASPAGGRRRGGSWPWRAAGARCVQTAGGRESVEPVVAVEGRQGGQPVHAMGLPAWRCCPWARSAAVVRRR